MENTIEKTTVFLTAILNIYTRPLNFWEGKIF